MEVVVVFPPRELANLLEPPMIARYGKFRHLFAIGGGNGSAGTRKNQTHHRPPGTIEVQGFRAGEETATRPPDRPRRR